MREYPQNVVTPTTRDLERNTCPVHVNARRLIKSLHNVGVALDISVSCRHMVAGTMCHSETFDRLDPLTWEEKCVYGKCDQCPAITVHVPQNLQNKKVTVIVDLPTFC